MNVYRVYFCAAEFVEGEYNGLLIDQPFIRSAVIEAENTREILSKIPENCYIVDCEKLKVVSVC